MRTTPLFSLVALALCAAPLLAEEKQAKQWDKPPEMTIDAKKQYFAVMDTTAGKITIELLPKLAPNHVNSFVFLAKQGFYDGVIFHRVIKDFMLQGGDPTGTGMGGPGYKLRAEFNDTKHVRGILSAARTADPDSAGSQFFLMHGDAPHLDGKYTVYGKVIDGLDVVDKIANMETDARDRPANPPKINSVKIEEKDAK